MEFTETIAYARLNGWIVCTTRKGSTYTTTVYDRDKQRDHSIFTTNEVEALDVHTRELDKVRATVPEPVPV